MEDIAIRIVKLAQKIKQCVPYSISAKRSKGTQKTQYYYQYTKDHKRKQKLIPSKDVKQALAAFAHKQELKQQFKTLQASVPCEERQGVRSRVRFFTQYGLPRDPFDPEQMKPRNEPNVYLDGTTRDSKSEIIISLLLELLKITYYYNTELQMRDGNYRKPDFILKNQILWEHLGKMDDASYAAAQRKKLEEYKALGVDKLMFTTEIYNPEKKTSVLNLQEIVKKFVEFQLISTRLARSLFRKTRAKNRHSIRMKYDAKPKENWKNM